MTTVVLSPHPDDAALSLGASIFSWATAGEEVLVVNSTGASDRDREDEQAMLALGASAVSLDIPDALDRGYKGGQLFKGPREDDEAIALLFRGLRGISCEYDIERVYVPMALGNHVDHVLTRDAARAWVAELGDVEVWLYEDYPYSKFCLKAFSVEDDDWVAEGTEVVALTPSDREVEAKIQAISAYGSQLAPLFKSRTLMGLEVKAYFQRHGERVWRVK